MIRNRIEFKEDTEEARIRAYNYSIGTTSGIVDLRFVTHRLSNDSMVCARFNFV